MISPLRNRFGAPGLGLTLAIAALVLLVLAPAAQASKQAVDVIEGTGVSGGGFEAAAGVAVNDSGAGGVPAGTVYVTDGGAFGIAANRGNRVVRFQRDDNGTPADTTDDTYSFVAAWGAGVESGGSDYEICTVAASCHYGSGAGGNGTLAGDGSLNKPSGIAVDQDSGDVYVVDSSSRQTPDDHFRVNVYSANGAFLRSFGWGVVESGPDDNGTGYEICKAGLDVCRAGIGGAGLGQLNLNAFGEGPKGIALSQPDGNPATGKVFLGVPANSAVNTYGLDGTSPGSIGSAAVFDSSSPSEVAIDSRGILYASNGKNGNEIERYDTENANGTGVGFLAPIAAGVNEVQLLKVAATAGTFKLTFSGETTVDLPFDAFANDEEAVGPHTPGLIDTVEEALKALPSIGRRGVEVGGGRGDASGSSPYRIRFGGGLGAKDLPQIVASNGSTPLSGGAGASVTTETPGQVGLIPNIPESLAVDPDSDGAGPDVDELYVGRNTTIQQFDAPGLIAPPVTESERHATNGAYIGSSGLAVEPTTGRLYVAGSTPNNTGGYTAAVFVLDNAGPAPTVALDSLSDATDHSITAHATIDPNGPPNTSYHFEYSIDGIAWKSTPTVVLGHQEDPQSIEATIDPPPAGLEPNTTYHVRLAAGRKLDPPEITPGLTATTAPVPPLAKTTGAPIRTTTTARLTGRVTPRNSSTTWRFEYGSEGPCDSNPCASTPSVPAGSGTTTKLVSEEVEGLQPGTVYHYRLVADNGAPGSPSHGADMTVGSRTSEELPGQSDKFAGPPGSDRAWELVSMGDSGGNPVSYAQGFADEGNRAVYGIAGGTPISNSGSFFSLYYSERPAGAHPTSGWQSRLITPAREDLASSKWGGVYGAGDLSHLVSGNDVSGIGPLWRLNPSGQPEALFKPVPPLAFYHENGYVPFDVSGDGSRVAAYLRGGTIDPAFPAASAVANLYDVDFDPPRLLSLMPDGAPAPCGTSLAGALDLGRSQGTHWISGDGTHAYFESQGDVCSKPAQLYVRDIGAEETKLVSGPPVSGPSCEAEFVKGTPGAVFFITKTRLSAQDTEAPGGCQSAEGNDVYRYDLAGGELECVTCIVPGLASNLPDYRSDNIWVADDGSRLYFQPRAHLLASSGTYRLNLDTGQLATIPALEIGEEAEFSHDGSKVAFQSDSAELNPLGAGSDNGGTKQYYVYDDDDGSLSCVSCPLDGSKPLFGTTNLLISQATEKGQPNLTALAGNGTFAFASSTPLVDADQNTPPFDPEAQAKGHLPYDEGTDIYEWRDGRQILVTDGLTDWPVLPAVEGISPSGHDIFFTAPTQYTYDAIDSNRRIYDARIDGGIDFPPPPKPCPLEVCQGTPKGAPEKPKPSSSLFTGRGNQAAAVAHTSCPKGRRSVRRGGKSRCVKQAHRKRHHKRPQRRNANHNRRAAR